MQIPQKLQDFKKPTMIAVTDSVQAKLYLARERSVNYVATITSSYPPKDDVERTSGESSSGSHFSEQSEKLDEVSREKLYIALSKDLMHRHQAGEFEELTITVPQEHMNELKESIHIDLLKLTSAWVPKLLTNDDIKDILMHVEAETFPEE